MLERRSSHKLAWHNGQTSGFHSFVGINAAKTLGVVVLSNDVGAVEPLAYTLLTGERLPKPPGVPATPRIEVPIAADELESYIGRYRMSPAIEIIVRREADRLLVQLTGQAFTRVVAEAKDRFFYRIVNAQLTFERNEAGAVNAVVLHQNGRDLRAPRI
jgi:D-alanyl-D-alanine-carboxypeptidase/D-alanyl-D-alanine-endopeptidase